MRQAQLVARLFGILAVSSSTRVHAADFATAQLHIDGLQPGNCAAAESLKDAVETRLGRRLFVAEPGADLHVKVTYLRRLGQWVADIELNAKMGQSLGQRRLSSQARDCSAMNESLALILALMVDLTRDEVVARSLPAPAHDSTEVHVPEGSVATPTRDTTDARVPRDDAGSAHWSQFLVISSLTRIAQVPGLGWGAMLTFDLRHRTQWAAHIGVGTLLPSSAKDSAAGRAAFSAYLASASLCRAIAAAHGLEWSVCAGTEVGILHAVGVGYRRVHTEQTPLISPFAGLESTWWPTTLWGFRLALGVVKPLIRDNFYAQRADGTQVSLFKPAFLSPFLQVGFCLHL